MKNVLVEDLKYKNLFGINYGEYQDGYRIVYFYPDGTYSVGAFSGDIEGFLMDFIEQDPIEDESDIPIFASNDDLLNRYLSDLNDISSVAIYKTDGACIQRKDINTIKHS